MNGNTRQNTKQNYRNTYENARSRNIPPYGSAPRNARAQYTPRTQRDVRTQYDPRAQRDARAQYTSRAQYNPRAQYDPRTQYAPRAQYDPRTQRDVRTQYDPRTQYVPCAQRDPRAEAYLRAERAEQLRRERARRAEYERRRAIEREKLRKIELQLKKERKMRRKKQRKIFYGRAAVTFVIFLILAAITAGILAIHFNHTPDSVPSQITYTFGGKTYRSVSDDMAFRDGKLYICFNDVADYMGLHVTGDADGMKFVFPDSDSLAQTGSEGTGEEDYVLFMTDSRRVVINSREITLDAESFLYGEEIWVSAEFINEYVSGLDITRDGSTVAVARLEDENLSTEEEPVYQDVTLTLQSEAAVPSPSDEEDENGNSALPDEPLEFKTDLSAYEQYMNPENSEEYLILVNSESTLDASYIPSDLTEVVNTRADGRETQLLRECAAYALEALYIEMYAEGYTDVSVMSGYRAYEAQAYLHEYYIDQEMAADPSLTREQAREIVLTYSAAPGTSEHQTGLCVDMHNLWSAINAYADEPSYA